METQKSITQDRAECMALLDALITFTVYSRPGLLHIGRKHKEDLIECLQESITRQTLILKLDFGVEN